MLVPAALAAPVQLVPVQADSESHLIAMWLHGRSANTSAAYRADVAAFLAFVGKPLVLVTVGDLQRFADSLGGLKPASLSRKLSSVKSLMAYAHRLGWLAFDVGAAVRLPKLKDQLAEKILCEADVQRLLAMETNPRNAVLLRLLYSAGLRISEAAELRWRDCRAREQGGQITVFGKGGKTRAVILPPGVWQRVAGLRAGAADDAAVFLSEKGGHLSRVQIHRIVKASAARAGLGGAVSAHWLRHAHVSHALDRGAPAHLVQATVGHASLATTSRYSHALPSDSSARYLAA